MIRKAGYTMIEMLIALVVLAIALGAAALVGLRSEMTFRAESARITLDGQARTVPARLTEELRSSAEGSVTALAESPTWDSALTFDSVASIDPSSGAIDWTTSRVELRLEAGELDDDVDNNNNGLVDEGRLVLIRDWGGPNEIEVVLTRWVAEYLDGESFDPLVVVDDNGNGLIDERGFCVERSGSTITLRLTLSRRGGDGTLATNTAETSVSLRN